MNKILFYYSPGWYDFMDIVRQDDDGSWWIWMIDDQRIGSPICVGKKRPSMRAAGIDNWTTSNDWDMARSILSIFSDGWVAHTLRSHDLMDESEYCSFAIIDGVVLSIWHREFEGEWKERIGLISDDRCFIHYFYSSDGDEPHTIPENCKVDMATARIRAMEILKHRIDKRIQIIDDWAHGMDVDEYDLYPFKRIIDEARRTKGTVEWKEGYE